MAEAPTARVRLGASRVFRGKAREFARAMDAALAAGDSNAAASAASHCAMSACDALLAAHRGVRSRSKDHGSMVRLVEGLDLPGARERADSLESVLSLKHAAEYDDRAVSLKDAATAVKQARRLLEWAESQMPA